MLDTNGLHLPDLVIRGFRGIEDLAIPRLGRVTLLAGRNSVGKTTVLDAIRVYAARGRFHALDEMLRGREEILVETDEDGDDVFQPDWTSLFYGRNISQRSHISVGPTTASEQLNIGMSVLTDEQSQRFRISPELLGVEGLRVIRTVFRGIEDFAPWLFDSRGEFVGPMPPRIPRSRRRIRDREVYFGTSEPPPSLPCESLGPGLLSNFDMARFWDKVALTEYANRAEQALGLIFGDDVEGVAMVGEDARIRMTGRRPIVKLKIHEFPVPLRSLGDGALRLFSIALALANSREGFLLIDEAENGIHYTLQSDFWRMILQSAHDNNVQVIATTHSWDCIRGFAQAATESEGVEGMLIRLSRQDGNLRAVEYTEEETAIAAEQRIEVR